MAFKDCGLITEPFQESALAIWEVLQVKRQSGAVDSPGSVTCHPHLHQVAPFGNETVIIQDFPRRIRNADMLL